VRGRGGEDEIYTKRVVNGQKNTSYFPSGDDENDENDENDEMEESLHPVSF